MRIKKLIFTAPSFVAFVIIFIFCSIISPFFFTNYNFQSILRQIAVNGFLALGLTMVILIGGIDLSIGSSLGLVAIISAMLIRAEVGLIQVILVAIIIGMAIGVTNGFLITQFNIEPFVITLGMQFVLRGLCFSLTRGRTIFVEMPFNVDFIANGDIGPIPFPAVLLGLVYFIIFLVMQYTVFGRHFYAIGGNEESARLFGVNVKLVKIAVYAICGMTAAIAGIINLSRISAGDPQAGTGVAFYIIAAVIIGGNKFTGGRGGLYFTIIGLFIVTLIYNIIILMGMGYYVQLIAEGTIVIIAALLGREEKQ